MFICWFFVSVKIPTNVSRAHNICQAFLSSYQTTSLSGSLGNSQTMWSLWHTFKQYPKGIYTKTIYLGMQSLYIHIYLKKWASLVAQLVKNLPAMQETWVRSLGWEDPLEKGKATHSSILSWRIPWTVQSMGSHEVGVLFISIL